MLQPSLLFSILSRGRGGGLVEGGGGLLQKPRGGVREGGLIELLRYFSD